MTLGAETVTFVSFTSGAVDELGIHADVPVEVDVAGCHFRPLRADETPQDIVDVATSVWKCTAPATEVTLAADSTGYLKHNNITYTIIGGAKPHTDFGGVVVKVTVLAQRQTG